MGQIIGFCILGVLFIAVLWAIVLHIRDIVRTAKLPRWEREVNRIVEEKFRDGDMDDIQSRAW